MKIVLGFVATAVLALAVGGCGSSSESGDDLGPDPDLASVQTRFDKPDGTFSSSNAAQVFDRGADGSGAATGFNFAGPMGGGGGASSTKNVGIQILEARGGGASPFACSALQSGQTSGSCACPSGGSFDYSMRADGAGAVRSALMKIRMNKCATGSGSIDGNEYLDIRTDATDQKAPKFSMLLVINADVTHEGVTKHIDLQSRFSNGAAEIAVKVDDGWVVVSVKAASDGSGGTWSVRDKNGSWTCTVDDGHGTCKSDKGETKTF